MSDNEFQIEMIDHKNEHTFYNIPFKPITYKEKRLICFSIINNEKCIYGSNCTYAHSLDDQKMDPDRLYLYQIVVDKNLMNFYSLINPKTDEIYNQLLFMTNICDKCLSKQCTGGYNCRHGICDRNLKLCKNDLLTGQCLNKLITINIPKYISDKIMEKEVTMCDVYQGCINGHHLSERNLVPYYKYVHQKETSRKMKYHSVRYIDVDSMKHLLNDYDDRSSDDDDDDEEIATWFNE